MVGFDLPRSCWSNDHLGAARVVGIAIFCPGDMAGINGFAESCCGAMLSRVIRFHVIWFGRM